MIFKPLFENMVQLLSKEFEIVFEKALRNQTHPGDLLLLYLDGFYDEKLSHPEGQPYKLSIGSDAREYSEFNHNKFILNYIEIHGFNLTFEQYKSNIDFSSNHFETINKIIENEEYSIQNEMLIYLKYWESDMIIKRWYQLVRILNRDDYDWHFRIKTSIKDNEEDSGKRHVIIREKIRDRLSQSTKLIHDYIKTAYKSQLRNCIAHSNYTLLNRNIGLNNFFIGDKNAQLREIPFDEWIEIFHSTIALHRSFMKFSRKIENYYVDLASQSNFKIPLRITQQDGQVKIFDIKRDKTTNLWYYD